MWFSSPAAGVPRLRCRWPPRPIRPSLNDQYGATCLLRLPHGWAPPLSLRRHRHAVGRGAPPSVLGAGSKQSRRKQPATHPQALAGTSFDQAFDGASQRVLEQRTFPPQFCVLDRKCASVGLVPPIAPGLLVSLIAGKAVARHGGAGRTQVVGDNRCQVSSDEDLRRAESHSRMATQADGRNQTHSYSLV
jgi:hypothetical protein